MRRGWEAVGVMGLTCLLLAVAEPSVRVELYGPSWAFTGLFLGAALTCGAVLVFPDRSLTRAGSGLLVSAAFAWRAVSAVVTDLFYGGDRPLYAVILYIGFAAYISLTWHRVLPAPEPVRRRIREWADEP